MKTTQTNTLTLMKRFHLIVLQTTYIEVSASALHRMQYMTSHQMLFCAVRKPLCLLACLSLQETVTDVVRVRLGKGNERGLAMICSSHVFDHIKVLSKE